MTYLYLYYFVIVTLTAATIYTFQRSTAYGSYTSSVKFRRHRIKELSTDIKAQLYNNDIDKLFTGCGIKMSSFTFNLVRYSIFITWALILFVTYITTRRLPGIQLILYILLLVLTIPKTTLFQHATPFSFVVNALTFEYKHQKNLEINRALSHLKNLSIISTTTSIGSDFIIEELMKLTKLTKPIFATTLKLWRENDKELAEEYFASTVDTKEGRELANIFNKLDNLGPNELMEQIALCQAIFKEERKTAKERRNEMRGYLLYAVVVGSILIILLNFVILILFTNTLEIFQNMNFKF